VKLTQPRSNMFLRIVESTDTYFIWEEEIHGHAKPLMAIVFFDGLMISQAEECVVF
jgi:hypothetical protein